MEPLRSDFADDAEMRELLVEFAEGLKETIAVLMKSVEEKDAPALRRVGHQLKGAGGGYGYGSITEAGARLEESVDAADGVDESVQKRTGELILLCQRARLGVQDF
ncbi:Hpt domain protein [Planctomycetes bacterium Pan216]|uniref:Hpt domain protein n=1 Tax=Kolteria novifilia TaxID=2527975 RepID=A0A518BB47_9BACT|nr:Hpt domain protein [Planctomycetes bacterium Pan216]